MPHKVPGVQTVDAAGASPAQQLSTSLHPTRAWFVTLADNSTLTAANLSKVFNTTDCDMADIRTCDLVPWIPHSTYITAVMWAPFPEHNQIVTGCFVLSEDYTLENGATCLVPGSHKLRRHPNALNLPLE